MKLVFPDCSDFMLSLYDAELRALLPDLVLGEAGPDTEGLLLLETPMDGAAFDRLPRLRWLVFLSTGVSSWIDLDAAAARGIVVSGVREYGDRSVAELALTLILDALRRVTAMDRDMRAGHWRPVTGAELFGKRLGVIGLGGIGRALAAMGVALGCETVGWNRTPRAVPDVRLLPLDELIGTSDIVSVHLMLTPETRGIIDARRIALLKPGAVLVNVARGALADEAALLARLEQGDIAAGLDVFEHEPLPQDHPFTRLDNVTLAAHSGWNTREAARRLLRGGLLTLRAAASHAAPPNPAAGSETATAGTSTGR
jgi:D-3-phosphoglycerate dehydrogenase